MEFTGRKLMRISAWKACCAARQLRRKNREDLGLSHQLIAANAYNNPMEQTKDCRPENVGTAVLVSSEDLQLLRASFGDRCLFRRRFLDGCVRNLLRRFALFRLLILF